MIEPQILYGVTCDRCGETLINSNDNSAWYDRSTAEEEASEEDWHSVSSHHYCPNCYREDDDGNRTIKAPFPYYVQKINRFMNRIAKSYPCRIVEEDDHFALHGNTQDGKQSAPCLHKAKYDTQADLLRRDMRDKFYYAMWNWIRRYWRNIGKAKDIAPQTAAAYERALDKQVEEVADLKYRLSSLTQWRDIQADPKWGFATDDAIDEIFRNLPRLVRDKRDGSIELIDYDNAAEWRGDLERKPSLYQWLPINGNTL